VERPLAGTVSGPQGLDGLAHGMEIRLACLPGSPPYCRAVDSPNLRELASYHVRYCWVSRRSGESVLPRELLWRDLLRALPDGGLPVTRFAHCMAKCKPSGSCFKVQTQHRQVGPSIFCGSTSVRISLAHGASPTSSLG